jgi:hypothetical protein
LRLTTDLNTENNKLRGFPREQDTQEFELNAKQ